MRIVVTGGLGFIGTSVVRRLIDLGNEVIVVDYLEHLLRSYETAKIPIVDEVYRNLQGCVDAFEPYEFLSRDVPASVYVHLGACANTQGDAGDILEKNVRYVRALSESLPHHSRVVFASSAAVYGTAGYACNAYGASKMLGENILRDNTTLMTTALRFFNVYGRNEHHKGDMASLPFKLAAAYRTRGRFSLFCPDASRDFVSVDQVAAAVVSHALEDPGSTPRWQVFDVGTGKDVTFRDLDYSLRVLFKRQESCCDEVVMPEKLKGRYQFYTKAGSRGTKISPYLVDAVDIRDLMEAQFIC